MIDYNTLRPGLYLQSGNSIKSLQIALEAWRSNDYGTGAPDNVETLAAAVAWVFIALERRKQRLSELPFQWRQAGEDIPALPFRFNTHETMPRLDEAIQLYKRAYLLKQRGAGTGALVGLRWLDPTTMSEDKKSWTPEMGIQNYIRTVDGRKGDIPASDLMVFQIPGMRELGPGTSAGRATSFAGQILYGVQQTADTVYDNNALPPMLVNVPEGTLETDKDTLVGRIRALLNPKKKGTREHRVIGVVNGGDKGVEIVPLNIKPDDLAMPELSEQFRDAILSGHFVPISEALSNASSRQTSDSNDAMRLTATMGARADWLASVINTDPDMQALELTLDYFPEKHWSMKLREMQAAQMFGQLLQGMTPVAAGYLAGWTAEAFPEEIRQAGIFRDAAPSVPNGTTVPAPIKNDTSAQLLADLDKWKRKAEKKLKATGKAACDFESDYIDQRNHDMIFEALADADTPQAVKAIFEFAV